MTYAMLEVDREMFERSFADATGYHRTAAGFARDGARSSLVFNLASVALERYLVALCAKHGAMPLNHNYVALMEAAASVVAFPIELEDGIRSLDRIFGLCAIDDYHHADPAPEDAARVLAYCDAIAAYFPQSGD